jgi:general secretion pathway protein B
MSLILDALKKSEAERQRNAGPTLLDVRIARPQRRYPMWSFIVGGLLLVNMVLLLIFVMRRPPSDVSVATNRVIQGAQPATLPAALPATPQASASTVAPVAPATNIGAPAAPPMPTLAAPTQATSTQAALPADEPADDGPLNPADDAPALPGPAATAQRSGGGSVKYQRDDSGGYSSLPSYSELGGNLPPLRLDLHVYAEQPRNRYAMINMQAVHEGDTLSEGMRVLAITRDGVALDYRGQQFMLHPQQ